VLAELQRKKIMSGQKHSEAIQVQARSLPYGQAAGKDHVGRATVVKGKMVGVVT
jgi:hypothetical protein